MRDTNDSTSQCESQYVWNKLRFSDAKKSLMYLGKKNIFMKW